MNLRNLVVRLEAIEGARLFAEPDRQPAVWGVTGRTETEAHLFVDVVNDMFTAIATDFDEKPLEVCVDEAIGDTVAGREEADAWIEFLKLLTGILDAGPGGSDAAILAAAESDPCWESLCRLARRLVETSSANDRQT